MNYKKSEERQEAKAFSKLPPECRKHLHRIRIERFGHSIFGLMHALGNHSGYAFEERRATTRD